MWLHFHGKMEWEASDIEWSVAHRDKSEAKLHRDICQTLTKSRKKPVHVLCHYKYICLIYRDHYASNRALWLNGLSICTPVGRKVCTSLYFSTMPVTAFCSEFLFQGYINSEQPWKRGVVFHFLFYKFLSFFLKIYWNLNLIPYGEKYSAFEVPHSFLPLIFPREKQKQMNKNFSEHKTQKRVSLLFRIPHLRAFHNLYSSSHKPPMQQALW